MIKLKHLLFFSLVATGQLVSLRANAQHQIVRHDILPSWIQDYPPFRIAGNLYYVGSDELACYLITTPKGHILINTGVAGSDTMIRRHVETLGFKFRDIKVLLASHAHFDHVGAMAAIKQETKAKMMMEEEDAPVLEDGGNSDFDFGGRGFLFEPVRVDRKLHDYDSILLGGMKIEVLHHPGHTKGASSFLFTVKDDKNSYRVLIANIPSILSETRFPSMPAYQNVKEDYAYTLNMMPKLQFDLWFAAHAGQFHLHEKHQPRDSYHPMAYADRPGYDAEIGKIQEIFAERLKSNDKIISYIVDPQKWNIQFYWKNDRGEVIGSIQRLKEYLIRKHKRLVFAMNGGMFKADNSPVGLFIQQQKTLFPLDTSSGNGNFYLLPNGVFYITTQNKAGICRSKDFINNGNIRFATQSGPMLLVHGQLHPAIKPGSSNVNIRNGVGILPDGKLLFAMSKAPINFYDFAAFFKDQGCSNALYLDGFVSRTYLPEKGWEQTDGNFGVIIGLAASE